MEHRSGPAWTPLKIYRRAQTSLTVETTRSTSSSDIRGDNGKLAVVRPMRKAFGQRSGIQPNLCW